MGARRQAEVEVGVVRVVEKVEGESLADWKIFAIESLILAVSRRMLSSLSTVGS